MKDIKNLYVSRKKNSDLLNDKTKTISEPFTNQNKIKQKEQEGKDYQ